MASASLPWRAVVESAAKSRWRLLPDARDWQIGCLVGLLAVGLLLLRFDVTPVRVALFVASALAAQWACTRLARLPAFEPRSALISALSLALLLRTNSAGLAAAAAAWAIASKFVLRVRGKHLFNPTNLALVCALATGRAWVSAGQWGAATVLAFAVACAGGLVVTRARRADVTLGFLAAWSLLLFSGCAAVGQPPVVVWHRLQNGALLLFAFFMISDPRTTPDSRAGRLVFAALVALGAWTIAFQLHRANALLWALAACSPLTPLLDRWLPGARHMWRPARPGHASEGGCHAEMDSCDAGAAVARVARA